jgi:glycosyltransferase involved in cell wall biosynthesis
MAPLVTVVTATWGRPRTITDVAIPSLDVQTYPDIQHIVVTDGRDPVLNDVMLKAGYTWGTGNRMLVNLGRNWSQIHGDGGVGAVPRQVGSLLAAGEYVCYLDDDNTYLPHHIATFVAALETTGADFATSRWYLGGTHAQPSGSAPPRRGETDTNAIMHRAMILKHGGWQPDGYESDGALVERWIAAGCRWTFVDEPTVVVWSHRMGAADGI